MQSTITKPNQLQKLSC